MKPILSVLVIALISSAIPIYAQNKGRPNTDKVTPADFNLPASSVIDSNANAVVLFDIGSVHYDGDKEGSFIYLVEERHRRIKILNKRAFDLATVKLLLTGRDRYQDKLENLQASTYTLDNGKVIESKISMTDVFEDRLSKYVVEKKFTFPEVKEGSIIEFSYKINSFRYYRVPAWMFQHFDVPCLYSEFELDTPDFLQFLISHQGLDSFYSHTSNEGYDAMHVGENVGPTLKVSSVIHKHNWVMKNISGFKEQPFMNAAVDYFDRLEFYLVETYNGIDLKGLLNWKAVTNDLLSDKYFGHAIDPDYSTNLKNTMEKLTADDQNLMDAARHIYAYVRDKFSCQPDNDIYINNDLYDVNKAHKGSVAELNLLLISLLRQKGLIADPVILSTRDYGVHPIKYPMIDKMNYVVCRLKLFGDTYYMDASKPYLGFGKLPLNCYNGHARIISAKDSGDIYLNPDNIKEQSVATVFLQNEEKAGAGMTASIQYSPGYFESSHIRGVINKSGQNDFIKQIKSIYFSDMEITNTGIDSVSNLDLPLKIHYDVGLKTIGETDVIYFSPILAYGYKSNPFSSESRHFPIEMDYPLDRMYVLNMEIPTGYVVDEIPKSAKVAFNENEGFYEYMIQKDETSIQLRCRIKLNRAVYSPDEYNSLRDFFGFVVKKESELITFKKKK